MMGKSKWDNEADRSGVAGDALETREVGKIKQQRTEQPRSDSRVLRKKRRTKSYEKVSGEVRVSKK